MTDKRNIVNASSPSVNHTGGIHFWGLIILLYLLPIMSFYSCEDPIELEIPTGRLKVVVEGQIDNSQGPFQVILTNTTNFNDQNPNPRITGATVKIFNDQAESFQMQEISPGRFVSDGGWKPETHRQYGCEIELDDGRVIRSAMEKLPPAPALDSLFVSKRFPQAIVDGQIIDEYLLNALITDPPGVSNFYRWQIIRNGEVLRQPNDIILFSDRFVDGTTFEFQLPKMLFKSGDSITVRHISISENAFDYLNLILAQSTRLGQATGTAPATLQGNLVNVAEPNEIVLGYFSVVSYTEKSIIIP